MISHGHLNRVESGVGVEEDVKRREQVRAWLLLRRRELEEGVESSLGELTSEDSHHLADLEELASDVSAEGVVFEQFKSSADTIAQIEHALVRLEDGTYEVCEDCGGPIGEERLAALPFVSQCVDCRRSAEETALSE